MGRRASCRKQHSGIKYTQEWDVPGVGVSESLTGQGVVSTDPTDMCVFIDIYMYIYRYMYVYMYIYISICGFTFIFNILYFCIFTFSYLYLRGACTLQWWGLSTCTELRQFFWLKACPAGAAWRKVWAPGRFWFVWLGVCSDFCSSPGAHPVGQGHCSGPSSQHFFRIPWNPCRAPFQASAELPQFKTSCRMRPKTLR